MAEFEKPNKQARRIAAMEAEMQRVLWRLQSLSLAMMRADAAWEAYHVVMTRIVAEGQSEDELVGTVVGQASRVENNDFSRASAYHTIWMSLLYVVIEGWRKWRFFDAEVDRLILNPFVSELQGHRHAIFHAAEFDDIRVMRYTATEDRTRWTSDVSNALRAAIRDWHANLRDRLETYLLRSPL